MNIVMSSKNTKVKSSSKSQSTEQEKTIVQQVVTTPVVEQSVATTPVVQQTHKGGKKASNKSEPVVQQLQVVVEPVVGKLVVEKPSKKANQKGGKLTAQVEAVVEPVVEPVVEAKVEAVVTKSTKKISKKAELVVQAEQLVQAEQVVQKAGNIKVELEEDEQDLQMGNRLRYFKLIYNNEIQGRYSGKKPKQAANKAFSSIIKDMKKIGNQTGGVNVDINFSIRECTRNSRHKEYKYVGIRETLNNPVKVSINNEDGSVKEITYNFHNKIQKAPKV